MLLPGRINRYLRADCNISAAQQDFGPGGRIFFPVPSVRLHRTKRSALLAGSIPENGGGKNAEPFYSPTRAC